MRQSAVLWHKGLLLAWLGLLLIPRASFAAEGSRGIPVPPKTRIERQEKRMMGAIRFDFLYYNSELEDVQIKDFYREKLTALGWSQRDYAREIEQLGVNPSAALPAVLDKNISFSKDEEQIVVTFMPEGLSAGAKTKYTLCYGKVSLPDEPLPALKPKEGIPVLLDQPKKDIAPVYPEASLVLLSELPNGTRIGYISDAAIEQVADYYRINMASFGWELIEEDPVQKNKAVDTLKPGILPEAICPSCKNSPALNFNEMELLSSGLTFKNDKGDKCKVILSSIATGRDNTTNILINYVEKKK